MEVINLKTLTDLGLNKIATTYKNSLSHVLYELDGVENQTDFFKIEIKENTVIAYVFFDESYKDKISNIRVIDKDNDIVAQDKKIYKRTVEKALYVVFKHEFMEV